jgi:hypothetical protein
VRIPQYWWLLRAKSTGDPENNQALMDVIKIDENKTEYKCEEVERMKIGRLKNL